MIPRDRLIEMMRIAPERIPFRLVADLLEFEGFRLFFSRGNHVTYFRPDGGVLTINCRLGLRKCRHPADVIKVLQALEL